MSTAAGHRPNGSVSILVDRLVKGEPLALSRAITEVENGTPAASAILSAVQDHLGKATVLGITGPPGAGKSTLIDALVAELRRRNRTVGVLAVDPSSPLTGGAILGDRVRMARHTEDAGVFVRSLASRGHLGGLFRAAWGVIQVMDAAGPDFIIMETVGAGQSEVEISDYSHANIVVCAPGLGDDIQAIKAGILEIAHILVVNKSDHPQAGKTVQQLEGMLQLRAPGMGTAQIVSTIATSGEGLPRLADLLEGIERERKARQLRPRTAAVRRLLANASAEVARRVAMQAEDPVIDVLHERCRRGELDLDAAALALLKHVVKDIQPNIDGEIRRE